MEPGDSLFFHGHTAHYTPPNVSDSRSAKFKINLPTRGSLLVIFKLSLLRRRALQYHYAAAECRFIQCPKEDDPNGVDPSPKPGPGSRYFDCDPSCTEKKYHYMKKGEMLVSGRDYGDEYI